MQYQGLTIEDFSGGLTDYPVGRPKELSQENQNLLLDIDNRYITRPGSSIDGGTVEARAKITSPVHGLLAGFTDGQPPMRLSTGGGFGKIFYDDGAALTELTGPGGGHLFDANHGAASDKRFSSAYWNGHYYITSGSFTQNLQKVFLDSGGVLRLRTAGLPAAVGSFTGAAAGVGTTFSYNYAACWAYTYTVGPRTFITRGKSKRVNIKSNAAISGGNAVTFSALPDFTLPAAHNYDTANIVLELYRTESTGVTLYKVADITYANALLNVYVDTMTDAVLILALPFYANGGTTEVESPPIAKFMHVTERGTAFYGHALDGADVLQNRVFQSIPGIPDGVPRTFYVDLNDDVTGLSSFGGLPLFFDRKNAYRGEGGFDRVSPGTLIARKIGEAGGCVSHNGIVQTEVGVFFPGDDGFYFTDGYKKLKISEEINPTYALVYANSAAKEAIQGTYDPIGRFVYWTYTDATNSDGMFVLHLRYGVKPNAVFTTIGANFEDLPSHIQGLQVTALPTTMTQNFRAKCVLFANRTIYRGDDRGYVFYFDASKDTDPRVEASNLITTWGTQAIPFDYRTVGLDFGTDAVRKWTPRITVKTYNTGDISLLVRTDRDQEGAAKSCKEIKHVTAVSWGEPGILWGDPALWEADRALFEDSRMLPVPGIRCSYRSFWLSNAFTVIQKSDNLGLVTLGTGVPTYRTAQLDTVAESWPEDILDYFISFAADNYVNKYLVTARSATTVTFYDPTDLAPPNAAGYEWQLVGFAKGDTLSIKGLVIPFALLSDSFPPYKPGTEGGNS